MLRKEQHKIHREVIHKTLELQQLIKKEIEVTDRAPFACSGASAGPTETSAPVCLAVSIRMNHSFWSAAGLRPHSCDARTDVRRAQGIHDQCESDWMPIPPLAGPSSKIDT